MHFLIIFARGNEVGILEFSLFKAIGWVANGLLINKATRHQLAMNCIFASPALIWFVSSFCQYILYTVYILAASFLQRSANRPTPPSASKPLPFCHKLVIILILAAYKATIDGLPGGGGGPRDPMIQTVPNWSESGSGSGSGTERATTQSQCQAKSRQANSAADYLRQQHGKRRRPAEWQSGSGAVQFCGGRSQVGDGW